MYQVFVRTWWKKNPSWPNGLEPSPGRKKHLCYAETIEEARKICQEHNASNKPGKYGSKAEFETA